MSNSASAKENRSIRLAAPSDAFRVAEMSRDLIEQGLGWSWTPRRVVHSIVDPDTNAFSRSNKACASASAS